MEGRKGCSWHVPQKRLRSVPRAPRHVIMSVSTVNGIWSQLLQTTVLRWDEFLRAEAQMPPEIGSFMAHSPPPWTAIWTPAPAVAVRRDVGG